MVAKLREFMICSCGRGCREWEFVSGSGCDVVLISNLDVDTIFYIIMVTTVEGGVGKVMTGPGVYDCGWIAVNITVADKVGCRWGSVWLCVRR